MSNQVIVIAPAALAVAAGAIAAASDAFGYRRFAVGLSILGLACGAGVATWSVYGIEGTVQAYNVMVGGAGFSGSAAVVLAISTLALLGGWNWFVESPAGGSAAALVALSAAAAAALAGGIDIVFILITLECLAISGYALVSQARKPQADEAAMKYLIQGAVATGLLVLATAMILGVYGGSTSIIELASTAASSNATPLAAAMALVVAGLGYKLGAFPFHSWAPDTFETAPSPSAGYMAAAPKVAAVLAAFILSSVLFSAETLPMWQLSREIFGVPVEIAVERVSILWAVLAVGSIVFGNLAALKQQSYARMLAYSGIAQVGYAAIGLALGQRVAGSSMLLVSLYGLAVLGAFIGAEYLRQRRPSWNGTITGMAGLGSTDTLVALAIGVAMFSLTGIPLTAGFWGKLLVFLAAAGLGWEWLVVIALLGSVVSFGYYGRVLKAMFFEDAPAQDTAQPAEDAPRALAAKYTTIAIGLALLVIGVAPLFAGVLFMARFFSF